MGFRELINRVKHYSGFSEDESKDALELMVESLAVHLDERERILFASQLPVELEDLALSVFPTEENSTQDMLQQFMEIEHIEEDRAKAQILSAWRALKDALGHGEIEHIRSQLPHHTIPFLR